MSIEKKEFEKGEGQIEREDKRKREREIQTILSSRAQPPNVSTMHLDILSFPCLTFYAIPFSTLSKGRGL